MKPPEVFILILLITVCSGNVFILLRKLNQDRELAAMAGLFCMGMGFFLLVLDLCLISFINGPQHIPDYLLFNRLVADSGFAGRWLLTVYLFFGAGFLISIYLLARNLISKFNK